MDVHNFQNIVEQYPPCITYKNMLTNNFKNGVLSLVLKICPRFLRRSRSDVLLLAFMHKHFILPILQFERDKSFLKGGFRPSTCTHATLFVLPNIRLTLILKCQIANNKTKLHPLLQLQGQRLLQLSSVQSI